MSITYNNHAHISLNNKNTKVGATHYVFAKVHAVLGAFLHVSDVRLKSIGKYKINFSLRCFWALWMLFFGQVPFFSPPKRSLQMVLRFFQEVCGISLHIVLY